MGPVPVSINPDEIIMRPMVTRVQLPALFDAPPIPVGTLVWIRRSPFMASARSYHVETLQGDLLALVTEQRMRQTMVPARKANALTLTKQRRGRRRW